MTTVTLDEASRNQIKPTCDARTGYVPRIDGWPLRKPLDCGQRVGLTAFRDSAGRTRHHCARDGHRASAVHRYGVLAPVARRMRVEGCSTCALDVAPPHDAAAGCESGGREHCSCESGGCF